jgi:hypothetical protein
MIAWSFDRVAPDKLGCSASHAHAGGRDRHLHRGAVVFMWLIAYKAVAFLTFIEVLLVIWGTVMVAAVVFPLIRKSLYESSPTRNFKILGVPVMPLSGGIATAFMGYAFWLLWEDANALPADQAVKMPVEAWITLGAVVAGTAWYLGAKAYRRRRGINISLAFQQIPIE